MVRRPNSSSSRISSLFELLPALIATTSIVTFMRIKEELGFLILGVCAPFLPSRSTFPAEHTGEELLPNNVKPSPGRRKLPFADRFASSVLLDPGAHATSGSSNLLEPPCLSSCCCWEVWCRNPEGIARGCERLVLVLTNWKRIRRSRI